MSGTYDVVSKIIKRTGSTREPLTEAYIKGYSAGMKEGKRLAISKMMARARLDIRPIKKKKKHKKLKEGSGYPGVKPWFCPDCGDKFYDEHDFEGHLEFDHIRNDNE